MRPWMCSYPEQILASHELRFDKRKKWKNIKIMWRGFCSFVLFCLLNWFQHSVACSICVYPIDDPHPNMLGILPVSHLLFPCTPLSKFASRTCKHMHMWSDISVSDNKPTPMANNIIIIVGAVFCKPMVCSADNIPNRVPIKLHALLLPHFYARYWKKKKCVHVQIGCFRWDSGLFSAGTFCCSFSE